MNKAEVTIHFNVNQIREALTAHFNIPKGASISLIHKKERVGHGMQEYTSCVFKGAKATFHKDIAEMLNGK